MEDLLVIALSFIFGIFFIVFSKHKKAFDKTAKVQGFDTAERKFRIIRVCGYFLIGGSLVYAIMMKFSW